MNDSPFRKANRNLILILATAVRAARTMKTDAASGYLALFKAVVLEAPQEPGINAETGDIEYSTAKGTRIALPISRYTRRILKVPTTAISDHLLAKLASELTVRAQFVKFKFDILRGHDIPKAYHLQRGGSSCMTERPGHTRLYEENADILSMLVFEPTSSRMKSARALLWNLPSGAKLMDRIYPSDGGNHVAILHQWAMLNGYFIRYLSGAPNSGSPIKFVTDSAFVHGSEGSAPDASVGKGFEVILNYPSTGLLPYMDSFHYGDILPDGRLHMYTSPRKCDRPLIFNKTSGLFTLASYCDVCGTLSQESNRPFNGQFMCGACFARSVKKCEYCGNSYPDKGFAGSFQLPGSSKTGRVCRDCMDFKLFHCPKCSRLEGNGSGMAVRDKTVTLTVCNKCADTCTNCDNCGAFVGKASMVSMRDKGLTKRMCEECAKVYTIKCTCCGSTEFFKGTPDDLARARDTYVCISCRRRQKQEQTKLASAKIHLEDWADASIPYSMDLDDLWKTIIEKTPVAQAMVEIAPNPGPLLQYPAPF